MKPQRDGLVARLDRLSQRIDDLTRRGERARPLLVVRIMSDIDVFDVEKKNVMPVTSWQSVPDVDNTNMWHYNIGGDTYAELPCAGRFRIVVATHWRIAQNYSSALPNDMATSLYLNARTGNANMFARESAWHSHGDSTSYTLVSEHMRFDHGDRIRVNFWAHYPGSAVRSAIWTTNAFTHMVISYQGPE